MTLSDVENPYFLLLPLHIVVIYIYIHNSYQELYISALNISKFFGQDN